MGVHRSDFTRSHRPQRSTFATWDSERDLLCSSHRMPVALPTHRISALEECVFVLLALAAQRSMGRGFGGVALGYALSSGSHRDSQRGDNRLAKRAHYRKRGDRGFDGNKRIKGRKRFTLSDCGGNWLESVVVPANTGERAGALLLRALCCCGRFAAAGALLLRALCCC